MRENGILHEGDLIEGLLAASSTRHGARAGRLAPGIVRALRRRKFALRAVVGHPHREQYRDLRRYFDAIEDKPERYELNLYLTGYEDEPGQRPPVPDRARTRPPSRRARTRASCAIGPGGGIVRVAYWPGCVSRGFTPELHGSMARDRAAARPRAGRTRPRRLHAAPA